MNRTTRRSAKKHGKKKMRRMLSWLHALIAIVAIIECLVLITFTTFSWIESNSSLIIQNGPESSQIADQTTTKKMDISKQLKSTINLNYPGNGVEDTFAPLNEFFSEVKYFEFAKATSSDGRTMFFPCRNNTYSTAGKYRKGDTIDYNTSFLYFDFVMSNKAPQGTNAENRDVYFDDASGYTDIFTVTGDNLTAQQKTALTNAMRMSITTQVNNGALSTKIFAKKAYSGSTGYKSIGAIPANQSYAYDENGGTGTTNNRDTWVTTNQLSRSVYHLNGNVIDSDKLFVAKKNADTKVSFRIWFDVWDPDFRTTFGLDNLDYSSYANSDAAYWKIPNATVGIKFKLKTSGNDLRSIYFDDYTLTNNAGININHLTDENPNYNVWFYAYQPYVPAGNDHAERTAGYYKIKLERESSDATHTLWSANTATASEMEYLMNQGGYANATGVATADRYKKSYFCYGNYDTNTAIYRWELPAAPVSEDFVFNAYSYMPNSTYTRQSTSNGWSDCSGSGIKIGVGLWQDDAASTMTLLKFKDMATAVTTGNYNSGDNFQIMNAAAVADNHTHYLVYANNYSNNTASNNFSSDVAKRTAAMYYDATAQVFKSYVPTGWLTGNTGVSFSYCPGGTFSYSGASLRWFSGATAATQNGGEYLYTALGYSNTSGSSDLTGIGYVPGFYSGSNGFMKGVGTWSAVEQIKFNTELIDNDLSSAYRYFVGISDPYSQGHYVMIPDESNMTFSAYIPSGLGATSQGAIKFVRMAAAKSSSSSAGPTAYWYCNARNIGNAQHTYNIFYPVDCTGTTTTQYTHGFWNVSVLVDGTYENLIYDTLTDGATVSGSPVNTYAPIITVHGKDENNDLVDYTPRDNYGKLEFSYDGQNWNTVCDDTTDTDSYSDSTNGIYAKMIDPYRFYVSAEGESTVYWRWTPYAGYTITFTANGQSKTVTAADTQFEYTHDVSDTATDGIYIVVTEAPST